jgi:hypothetical protein
MADLITHIIKSYLYERQEPKEGILDGKLYVCMGILQISKNVSISKSIFPVYVMITKHRGNRNNIYYKVLINRDSDGKMILIGPDKSSCEAHYFTKPSGAIHLLTTLLSGNNGRHFTFIIEGSCIGNYVITFEDNNQISFDPRVHVFLQNILSHYEYTDFLSHQYYSKSRK